MIIIEIRWDAEIYCDHFFAVLPSPTDSYQPPYWLYWSDANVKDAWKCVGGDSNLVWTDLIHFHMDFKESVNHPLNGPYGTKLQTSYSRHGVYIRWNAAVTVRCLWWCGILSPEWIACCWHVCSHVSLKLCTHCGHCPMIWPDRKRSFFCMMLQECDSRSCDYHLKCISESTMYREVMVQPRRED